MSFLGRGSRPLAKVCGLTSEEATVQALEAGADLLGFVSYPASPRHLDLSRVSALAKLVQAAGRRSVLVTVDPDRGATDQLVRASGLCAVQLCGTEHPTDWADAEFPILRRIGVGPEGREDLERWRGVAAGFVLDSPSSPGGTGEAVDLALARELGCAAPALLAGGLHAHSPLMSLREPLPFWGYDASSRLESSPGVKDPGAVSQFVRAVHALDSPIPKGLD